LGEWFASSIPPISFLPQALCGLVRVYIFLDETPYSPYNLELKGL